MGDYMQLSEIYKWVKAQHKDLVYKEGIEAVPSASRWIKFTLLPKLEALKLQSTIKKQRGKYDTR